MMDLGNTVRAFAIVLAASTTLAAQAVTLTPAQKARQDSILAANGKTASSEQIADALKKSGLTDQQVRDRLRQAGYDPSLADPYLQGARPGTASATAAQSTEFARMLSTVGILDAPPSADSVAALAAQTTGASSTKSNLFGKDIFDRASTAFDPVSAGPVDPSYRVGVGDQLQLVVTGQVELYQPLEVRRDGTVIIPQVGQIPLAGLTLDAARAVLRTRMGKSYSGLETGEARLDLSVSKLRTIAVFVIGEVEHPGAIQVNALGTVFSAIAKAGGPTERGSFRNIEVRRGGRVAQKLDIYDYLLNGDASSDIRLEQGDYVFVPLNSRLVTVSGQVRRPKKFELLEKEGFDDLLRFAGGWLATASVSQVQIDRVLPPSQRRPGVERVKLDVDLLGAPDSVARVRLFDGDSVTFFAVDALRRNVVSVSGEVYKPGDYQLTPGMTVGDLLRRAQGLMPWAIGDRLKIVRRLTASGKGELLNVDATTAEGLGTPLAEFDLLEVLDLRLANPGGKISVDGAVVKPGERVFLERETLRDAIERAGGFLDNADVVELFRRRSGPAYSDTTTLRSEFRAKQNGLNDPMSRFVLERDDRIAVRVGPGRRDQKFVTLVGLWVRPGRYAVNEGTDRLSDVVALAGGGLPNSYPAGFRLTRTGKPVAVDFLRAMKHDAKHDIGVLDGDALEISYDPATVLVTGAVSRAVLVHYEPGLSMRDYIERAGGPTDKGDAGKAVIDYPSGDSKRIRRIGFFYRTSPVVLSGSTIIVPEKPPETSISAEVLTRLLTVTSALASLLVAYSAIRR